MEYHVMTPVSILLRMLESSMEFLFVIMLLGCSFNKKKYAGGIVVFTILFETIRVLSEQYLSSSIAVVLAVPILIFITKEKWWKVLLSYLCTIIVVALIDCILCYIILIIFELNSFSEITENMTIYSVGSVIISTVLFLFACMIYYWRNSNTKNAKIEQVKNVGVIITNLVTFMLLMPNLVMLLYYHDRRSLPFGIIFINICSIIILFFVNAMNTRKGYKLVKSEQDLIAQKKYSKTQQDLIDGLRTFKHDYSNTLQTMRGYVEYNKIDKLKEMFEQVLDETKAITTLDKLNPNTIKDPGLFGILSGKYQKAKENNIKMEVEIFGDIEGINIEIFDLTRMLGILLDNAIEAAKNSKKRKITFMLTERKDEVSFEITNTYSGKEIDLKKIKEKGVSSKGQERGLGLYKVEEIIHKYDSVKNVTQIEGDIFIQILTIYKKKISVNV